MRIKKLPFNSEGKVTWILLYLNNTCIINLALIHFRIIFGIVNTKLFFQFFLKKKEKLITFDLNFNQEALLTLSELLIRLIFTNFNYFQ